MYARSTRVHRAWSRKVIMMVGGGFKNRSVLATHARPCPICGRPESGEPKAKGTCRISAEHEFIGGTGDTVLIEADAEVHCWRVDVGSRGPYQRVDNDDGLSGTFYRRQGGVYAVRDAKGNAVLRQSRPASKPRSRPKPVAINRLELPTPVTELSGNALNMSQRAGELWRDEMCRMPGLAIDYLVSRGIDRASMQSLWPVSLMFHPAVYNAEAKTDLPAMLCRVTAPDGAEVATHRIYLNCTGTGKADLHTSKMMLGPTSGGAIRLGSRLERDAFPGGVLVITEGVETAMAIRQVTDYAVWACVSTSGLTGLLLPVELIKDGSIKTVVIAADIDGSKVVVSPASGKPEETRLKGQQTARKVKKRLRSEYPGLRVIIAWPGVTGVDA